MNLYLDFISIKGFNFEEFKRMASSFKEGCDHALFKSQNLWFPCVYSEQDSLIDDAKYYFSKYTLFSNLEIIKENDGLWLTPVLDDFHGGGKGSYLEDLLITQYALGLKGEIYEESELKTILPYEHYFLIFFNQQMRESISFWTVNKEVGYNKVRGLILKNSSITLDKKIPENTKKDTVILKADARITKEGFPFINKDELLADLRRSFKERPPKE